MVWAEILELLFRTGILEIQAQTLPGCPRPDSDVSPCGKMVVQYARVVVVSHLLHVQPPHVAIS